MHRASLLVVLAFTTSACGEEAPSFDYPLDDTLRLQHVRVRGTHNSYHIEPDPFVNADLAYSHSELDVQLSAEGVRQIELDLNYDFARERFEVYHIFAIDEGTTCRLFTECLEVVERWSRHNPAHAPVAIMVEPKDPFDESYAADLNAALDAEIASVFDLDRLITPELVRGDAATLREGLATVGWPTLGQLRGRVLFWMDNHADWSRSYSNDDSDLEGRLAFVDSSLDAPYAAVRVLNDPVSLAADIDAAVAANQLVRTRVDRVGDEGIELDPDLVDAAFAGGAHFISSDVASFAIPGGMPFACNPDTAPIECDSASIEDPEFVD